jgi:hypothetical protein
VRNATFGSSVRHSGVVEDNFELMIRVKAAGLGMWFIAGYHFRLPLQSPEIDLLTW